MKLDNDKDIHYAGNFDIIDENLSGELVYNLHKGIAIVAITKPFVNNKGMGKSYEDLPIIKGCLNDGTVVTLFNNHCIKNCTMFPRGQ